MIVSLNHFTIRTTDLEATRAFYEDVLGLANGPRPPFPFPGLWLYNGDPTVWLNAMVHVISLDKNNPEGLKQYLGNRDVSSLHGSGAVDHIALAVTGLEEMIQRLDRLGVPYRERTVPVLELHQLFLDDPSGVVIELNYPALEQVQRCAKTASLAA